MTGVDSVFSFRPAIHTSRFSRLAVTIVTALGLLFSSYHGTCSAADGKIRIAIVDFRPSTFDLQEIQELQKLVATAQGNLASERNIEWIERGELARAEQELFMASSGMLRANSELRIGKWVKADWLITGDLRPRKDASRSLHIEVLDLARADSLASVDLEITSGEKLVLQKSEHTRVTEEIRDLLKKAAARLQEVKGRTVVAPLFFRNQEAGGRLAYFEEDLQKAFIKADRTEGKVRVLQFRRAGESRAEAELAIAGLTENTGAAEQPLANMYVWGTFAEQNPSGTPFPNVPVKVEVNLWQEGQLRRINGLAPVRELSKLAENIVRQVCSGNGRVSETSRALSREALAAELYDRAQELIYENFGVYAGGFNAAWHRRRIDAIQFLEVASFLDPKNVKAERELLLERWRDDISTQGRDIFATLLCSAEWKQHFEKHGLAYEHPRMRRKPDAQYTDNRAPSANNETILIWTQLKVLECISRDLQYRPESPQLSAALQMASRIAHEEELLRRIEVALSSNAEKVRQFAGTLLLRGLEQLSTPANEVRLIELLQKLDPAKGFTPEGTQKLEKNIREAYTSIGKPEQAEILVSGWKSRQPDKKTSRSTWSSHEPLPPLEASDLPPKIAAEPRLISFGNDYLFQGILSIGWHRDRLWVSTEGSEVENPGMASAIWTYTPGAERPQRLREHFDDNPQVSGFLTGPDGALWITFATQGVWRIAVATSIPTRFEERDGLASPIVITSATDGERLYFGGGSESTGKLSLFTLQDHSWASLTMDFTPGRAVHPPVQAKQLAAYKNWLLVYGDSGGSSRYNYLYNHGTRLWSDLKQVCFPPSPVIAALPERSRGGRMRITSATSDAAGFWIGSRSGVVFYQPETGTATDLLLPNRSAGGEVTAMAHDGDYLWVAAYARQDERRFGSVEAASSHLFVLHKPSRKWLGCIEVPKEGYVQSLAVGPEHVWAGFTYTLKTPLLEINKRTLPWVQK